MTHRIAALIAAVVAAAASVPVERRGAARSEAAADLGAMRGRWSLTAMEAGGAPVAAEDLPDWGAEFEGDLMTLRAAGEVRRRCIVTLDPGRHPGAINAWDLGGPLADRTSPGIYALGGGELKLCLARAGQDRPREFATGEGGGDLLLVFRRDCW